MKTLKFDKYGETVVFNINRTNDIGSVFFGKDVRFNPDHKQEVDPVFFRQSDKNGLHDKERFIFLLHAETGEKYQEIAFKSVNDVNYYLERLTPFLDEPIRMEEMHFKILCAYCGEYLREGDGDIGEMDFCNGDCDKEYIDA